MVAKDEEPEEKQSFIAQNKSSLLLKGANLMKKTLLYALSVLFVIVLVVTSAVPGAAQASRITTCALQTTTGTDPGKMWLSEDGTILYIRNQIEYADITALPGHPECDASYNVGHIVMEVNINLNLVTGAGNAYGKMTIYPDAYDGTWVGSFNGTLQDFMMTGKAVSQGTGELKGLTQKSTILQTGEITFEVYGTILSH